MAIVEKERGTKVVVAEVGVVVSLVKVYSVGVRSRFRRLWKVEGGEGLEGWLSN